MQNLLGRDWAGHAHLHFNAIPKGLKHLCQGATSQRTIKAANNFHAHQLAGPPSAQQSRSPTTTFAPVKSIAQFPPPPTEQSRSNSGDVPGSIHPQFGKLHGQKFQKKTWLNKLVGAWTFQVRSLEKWAKLEVVWPKAGLTEIHCFLGTSFQTPGNYTSQC